MNAVRIIVAVLGVVVVLPIWLYLTHWSLVKLGAGDLQMFLFWIYAPLVVLFRTFVAIADSTK